MGLTFAHVAKLLGATYELALSFFPFISREPRVGETIDLSTGYLARPYRAPARNRAAILGQTAVERLLDPVV